MQFQMAQFIDYVLASGASDFYRPVREAIVDMHTQEAVFGGTPDVLDNLITRLADPRERRIFPKVVAGYKKFLRSGRMSWFEPPMRDYPLGPLAVRVAPEVGLLINGQPHAIKLYFRGDPLSPRRIVVTNQLMVDALSATWPTTVFAVLDVRRARLFRARPKPEVGALLKAEALSLASLWSGL